MSKEWSSGLCSCFDDTQICLIGTFCSCWLYGQNAEQIDGSNKIAQCLLFAFCGQCCGCLFHKSKREKLRNAYSIREQPNDLLAVWCCGGCANCQEAREIKGKGVQPGGRITSQPR